jgi:hypothetical protein
MRKKLLATALALGTAASARANPDPNPPTNIAGSDTMREISIDLINACNIGGAAGSLNSSLVYIGGGTSFGGTRMSPTQFGPNGMQQVAPQSRFLSAAECSAAGPNQGQGVQIGLDGLAVFHDNTEFTACRTLRYAGCMAVQDRNNAATLGYGNGVAGIDDGAGGVCTGAGTCPALGLSDGPDADGQLDHYCFTHWADALRIIYNGQHAHLNNSTPSAACNANAPTASGMSTKRCNSDVRRTLVDTWANMFDTSGDDGAGGCTDSACTQLQHAWRRDDFSGTTDTFLALIGVPGVTASGGTPFGQRTFCNGLENEDLDPIRRPCSINSSNAANDPVAACAPVPFANRNAPFGADGSPSGASGSTLPTAPAANARGDLGLVLAISLPTELNVQYDVNFCTTSPVGGAFRLAQMPSALSLTAQRCPDGNPRSGGQCRAPVYQTGANVGRFNCRSRRTNRPGGLNWPQMDARVYNLTPRDPASGVILQPNHANVQDPRWGGGGHYRIHMAFPELSQTATPLFNPHPTCRLPDATRQIGCLVQADACSIGFAGLEAEDQDVSQDEIDVLGTNLPFALRVPLDTDPGELNPGDDEIEPRVTTIHRLVDATGASCENGSGDFDERYPLSRILWFNASKGFGGFPGTLPNISNMVDSDPDINPNDPTLNGTLTPDGTPDLLTREQDFARCYVNRTLMDPILEEHGYIPLPPLSVYPETARFRQCP